MAKKRGARKTAQCGGAATNKQCLRNCSRNNSRNSQMNTVSLAPSREEAAPPSSKFFDLSLELRYKIYEYHLRYVCNRVVVVRSGRLLSNTALHLVCRQIDNELTTFLATTARASRGKLCYALRDFDFKPAIAALTWLVNDTKLLTPTKICTRPLFRVDISISKAWNTLPTLDSLPNWNKWVNAESNKAVRIVYGIGKVEDADESDEFLNSLPHPGTELQRMLACFNNWIGTLDSPGEEEIIEDSVVMEILWAMSYGVEEVGMVGDM